jgi:hypothetical protein
VQGKGSGLLAMNRHITVHCKAKTVFVDVGWRSAVLHFCVHRETS